MKKTIREVFISNCETGTAWSPVEDGKYCIPVRAILFEAGAAGWLAHDYCVPIYPIRLTGGRKKTKKSCS